jgi:hypothetical protein
LVIAVAQWTQRNGSPFGVFDGVAPRYNPSQLDRTCEFLQQSVEMSLARWVCSHTSIAMWDDAFQKDRSREEDVDLPSDLFFAHSL